jgi:hypothetical protein
MTMQGALTQTLDADQCQTNTIPLLMHQMDISTNKVSSVMLSLKKLEKYEML